MIFQYCNVMPILTLVTVGTVITVWVSVIGTHLMRARTRLFPARYSFKLMINDTTFEENDEVKKVRYEFDRVF